MKKFYLIFLVSLFIIGLNSCKKENNHQITEQISEEMERSVNVIKLIKQFEEQLNSDLKSAETMSLDSAVWYMEASLNYYYADPDEAEGEYSINTQAYSLPLDENGEVLVSDVQTFYEQMEDDLGNNQKLSGDEVLVFSDVAVDSIVGGTAYMSGTNGSSSGFGGSTSPFDEDDDWIWGTVSGILEGKCDGTMVGVSDGSNELEWHLNNPVGTPTPPFYTDIEIVEVNYELCEYLEPPELPRIFNSLDGDHCMEYTEMNYFYDEADIIIYDYNDPTNDGPQDIYVYEEEGARPAGKDFISISIIDSFSLGYSTWFHLYKITYGVPNIAPID